jgi:hypothetical protein
VNFKKIPNLMPVEKLMNNERCHAELVSASLTIVIIPDPEPSSG